MNMFMNKLENLENAIKFEKKRKGKKKTRTNNSKC